MHIIISAALPYICNAYEHVRASTATFFDLLTCLASRQKSRQAGGNERIHGMGRRGSYQNQKSFTLDSFANFVTVDALPSMVHMSLEL